MLIEAAVLTGGQSRRMGEDKASLQINGVPQAERIVRSLRAAGIEVTTLGRAPVEGASFLADEEEFRGPLAALARFKPTADAVFVSSCDLPRFDASLVRFLADRLGGHESAVPFVDGYRQPLCALYRRSAWDKLPTERQCAMGWLEALDVVLVSEQELLDAGVSPASTRGANSREELDRVLNEA